MRFCVFRNTRESVYKNGEAIANQQILLQIATWLTTSFIGNPVYVNVETLCHMQMI